MTAATAVSWRHAFAGCRAGLIGVSLLSATLAILPAGAALYIPLMLDTALAGHSGATIVGLALLGIGLVGVQLFCGMVRGRMLTQLAYWLSLDLGQRLDQRAAALHGRPGAALAARHGVEAIRHATAGAPAAALLDLPVLLVAFGVLLLLHIGFALILLAALGLVAIVAWPAIRSADAAALDHADAKGTRDRLVLHGALHGELLTALGMAGRAAATAADAERTLVAAEQRHRSTERAAIVQGLRTALAATLLAFGTWLAVEGQASVGIAVAATWLGYAALAPVALLLAAAPTLATARIGARQVGALLQAGVAPSFTVALPAPVDRLQVQGLGLATPGMARPVIRDVGLRLAAGEAMAIVGPSGSGKSALLRAIVGGWPPAAGTIRLDGATLDQWEPAKLGRHIGYLPQDIALFEGSVADNIARFDPIATSAQVTAAAMAAGAHEMIVRLPRGYATPVGADGSLLSVGECQRIALARALFGDPFMVVLDAPAAHGDGVSQAALAQAIAGVRARGGIVVGAGSSGAMVDAVSHLLVLRDGEVTDRGPRDAVRARLLERKQDRPPIAATPADRRAGVPA